MKATTMKHGFQTVRMLPALAAGLLAAALAPAPAAADLPAGLELRFELRPAPELAGPPLPPPGVFPIQLVLDDDSAEGTVGVSDASGARQFLWFNRFTPPGGAFDLEEVWVLFPTGVNMAVGDAVQLAVWLDPDGDPSNGASLLATFDETIQVLDGATFSVYPLAPPVTITDPGDVLIGVVPRFIAPGDPPTAPAAVDTTASQQRSWIAIWTGDPPNPPALPPDLLLDLIDNVAPAAAGNWMIRGFGGPPPAVVIPALDGSGLALLALLLAAAGFVALRRLRRRHGAAALGLALLAAAALGAAPPAAAQVVIDEFSTLQGPVTDPPGGGSTAVTGGADILGGKRGLRVRNLAGPGPTSAEVAGGALDFSVAATTPDSRGEADVTWDGDADNDPATFDPTGLGPVDLTDGGTQGGVRLTIEQAQAGTHLVLTIWEDADHVSRAGRVLPAIAATTNLFINFGELVATPGAMGPADLTQVGAVTLRLGAAESPSAPTLRISHIETAPPAVAATKIDTVGGTPVGGPVPPGTTLRYRVTITNPGAGGAEGVAFDDLVTDPNLGAPGPFRSTPLARRDQYRTVTDTPLDTTAPPLPPVVGNDVDPDGDPLSVGGVPGCGDLTPPFSCPTANGGTVVLQTDGHFLYTPAAGFQGVDAFPYALEPTAGDPPGGPFSSTAYVTIDRVPPEITAGGTLDYTENDPPTAIDPALTVVDVDSPNLFGATAQITGNYAMGEDVLGFVDAPPITGNWVPATGTLTLTGTDTVANYQAALRSVTYENTSDDPSTLQRTVTWTATDGGETSAPATSTINVTAVNDAPVVTTTGGVTPFTEDGGPVVVDSMLTVTDADDANLESATVSLMSAPDGAMETLGVNNAGANCPGLAVTPGNPLTITGSALVATYQTCLRNVTYDNASQDPNTTDRTVQFVANDGDDDSNTATKTVTVTAVNDPPVAGDDAWDTIGNTQLVVDLAALATPHVLDTTTSGFGVLDNDADPAEGDALAVSGIVGCGDVTPPFVCPTVNGGSVTMEANGRFTFTPLAGDPAASDSFQYTVTDDGTPAPASDIGMVTITLFEQVWYVRNNAAAGGLGRSHEPFDTLAEAQTASVATDWIFVYFGDGTSTGQAAGIVLKNGQHLVGEHAGLSIAVNLNGNGSPTNLVTAAPGSRPLIDRSGAGNSAVAATNAIPIEIIGLSLQSAGGNAIDVTNAVALPAGPLNSLSILNNVIRGAGIEGIDVNLEAGTTGTLLLGITGNSWNTGGTHTGNAVDVSRAAGTLHLNFSSNTNIVSAATAVNIAGGAAANTFLTGFANNTVHPATGGGGILVSNATFDATPGAPYNQISGGVTTVGTSGDSVGGAAMMLTGVAGDLAFTDLDLFASGAGLSLSGTGAVNVGAGTGTRFTVGAGMATIEATGGPAVNAADATVDLQLAALTVNGSPSTGVSLVNLADAINPVFPAVFSAPSGSSIGATTGTAFNLDGGNATVSYAGTITNAGGRAVVVQNRTGDTATFTGGITDTGTGILINANNAASTTSFRGGVSLTTGAGAAFTATSGGTVEVCDENPCNPGATGGLVNTLTTTTGTALNVANTTISANNLEFRSITAGTAASGPANGIVLNNTGASGGLKVKGTGSAGSGGTIQRCGTGISLTSTRNVSLDRMQLNDHSDFAIRGSSVVNFDLANTTISGTNGNDAGANEGSVRFSELTGSATVTNCDISGSVETTMRVENTSGSLNRLTITGTTFGANHATTGDDGLFVQSNGTATVNVTVQNSFFTSARGDLVQMDLPTGGGHSLDLVFTGNALSNNHPNVVSGGGGTTFSAVGGTLTYDISNNTFRDANGAGLAVSGGNAGVTTSGTIAGNTIGVAATANSGSISGSDIAWVMSGGGTHTTAIRNNMLFQYNNHAILIQVGDQMGNPTNANVTVTGNTASNPGTINTDFNGIHLNHGVVGTDNFTSCVDIGGAGPLANDVDGKGTISPNNTDIRLRQRQATTVRLPGYGGANNNDAAVQAYLAGRNTVTTTAASNTVPTGGGFIGGAACTQP